MVICPLHPNSGSIRSVERRRVESPYKGTRKPEVKEQESRNKDQGSRLESPYKGTRKPKISLNLW